MSQNYFLQKASGLKDTELLQIIKFGTAKHAALKRTEALHSQFRRKRTVRCTSVTMFPLARSSLKDMTPTEVLANHPHDRNFFEISLLIDSVFKKVLQKYKATSWVRAENHGEVHIAALKQFWLDCYVCDMNFMEILLEPLHHKVWIAFNGFTKAIENTQRGSAFAIFSLKRYDKRLQLIFQMQKMIFFFCFIQTEVGSAVNRENLVKVLSMANKKEKTQLFIWADHFIHGVNKQNKTKKDFVCFEEFFNLIKSQM